MADRCSIADAMTILGGRWAVMFRELDYGRRRCNEILTATRAPREVLTTRLRELKHAGRIRREQYSQHSPRAKYHLTPAGEELGPVLMVLAAWGEKRGKHSDLTAPVDFRHADHHLSRGWPAHSAGTRWNRAAFRPDPIPALGTAMSRWVISRGMGRAAPDRSPDSSADERRAGSCG
ncbi:winged helix-turn-helix transcriptional regulator [Arthrobacter zhaoguopingii]|uniref:winged helix-turn-helix transcriptional regulator n=1 Tax=Arthrobacter zhaoguopingii TaxID=2681491 RepID=UPI00135956E0|nr:helix-turn-helix domain-containing protein [Arthrobacter zhaoguopingii]